MAGFLPIVTAGLGVLGSLKESRRKNEATVAQNRELVSTIESQIENVVKSSIFDLQTLETQEDIAQVQTDQEIDQIAEARRRERAELAVAFSDAGVIGPSPTRELIASLVQEGFDVGIREEDFRREVLSLDIDRRKVEARAESRIEEQKGRLSGISNEFISPLSAGVAAVKAGFAGFKKGKKISDAGDLTEIISRGTR